MGGLKKKDRGFGFRKTCVTCLCHTVGQRVSREEFDGDFIGGFQDVVTEERKKNDLTFFSALYSPCFFKLS